MSLDADAIVDRRRLRRKLTFWRVAAALVVLLAIAGAVFACRRRRPVQPARRLHRPHPHRGADPQQSGARRGA